MGWGVLRVHGICDCWQFTCAGRLLWQSISRSLHATPALSSRPRSRPRARSFCLLECHRLWRGWRRGTQARQRTCWRRGQRRTGETEVIDESLFMGLMLRVVLDGADALTVQAHSTASSMHSDPCHAPSAPCRPSETDPRWDAYFALMTALTDRHTGHRGKRFARGATRPAESEASGEGGDGCPLMVVHLCRMCKIRSSAPLTLSCPSLPLCRGGGRPGPSGHLRRHCGGPLQGQPSTEWVGPTQRIPGRGVPGRPTRARHAREAPGRRVTEHRRR